MSDLSSESKVWYKCIHNAKHEQNKLLSIIKRINSFLKICELLFLIGTFPFSILCSMYFIAVILSKLLLTIGLAENFVIELVLAIALPGGIASGFCITTFLLGKMLVNARKKFIIFLENKVKVSKKYKDFTNLIAEHKKLIHNKTPEFDKLEERIIELESLSGRLS